MVFSDLFFLFVFLPTFALCYMAAHWTDRLLSADEARPTRIVENATLVIFSLIFYAWGEPVYVFLMLFCVLLNYLAGLGIGHPPRRCRHRVEDARLRGAAGAVADAIVGQGR